MKSILAGLLVLSLAPAISFAQGQVVFANKVGTIVDAPVFITGTFQGPGPDYTVQLNLQGAAGSLTPLAPASVFRAAGSGTAAVADRYWVNQTVDVPGVAPGQDATFVVRAWKTAYGSYDGAKAIGQVGESAPFTITVGGNTLPPANLTTLQGFSIIWPEPSPIILGLIGASLLLLWRPLNAARVLNATDRPGNEK